MIETWKLLDKSKNHLITADNLNIYNHLYTLHELEYIIKHFNVSQTCILACQHLDASFCIKYILCDFYSRDEADDWITIDDCLFYQKHLVLEDFKK